MTRYLVSVLIVQAQLDGLGPFGPKRKVNPVFFNTGSKPERIAFPNHVRESKAIQRPREADCTMSLTVEISRTSSSPSCTRQRQLFVVVPGMFSRASDPSPR